MSAKRMERLGRAAGLEPIARKVAGHQVQRLLGFWVLWHSFGGMEPLLAAKIIARTGVYVQRKEFRKAFGIDVEDFWPEIAQGLHPRGERVE